MLVSGRVNSSFPWPVLWSQKLPANIHPTLRRSEYSHVIPIKKKTHEKWTKNLDFFGRGYLYFLNSGDIFHIFSYVQPLVLKGMYLVLIAGLTKNKSCSLQTPPPTGESVKKNLRVLREIPSYPTPWTQRHPGDWVT